MKEDLLGCLAMMLAICEQSPNWPVFIFTRTFSTSSTIQIYLVKCTLSEHPNIIIRNHNKKTFNIFPKLLQPNIMDYFKQVISRHLSKLLHIELLQAFSKENKSYIGIMKTIKQLHTESQGVLHVT